VEAQASEVADPAERTTLVVGHHPLGRILDDDETMLAGERGDAPHVAPHAAVVDRHDRAGSRGDGACQLALVEVQRVLANVDEDRARSAQCHGVGRRNEGE
jgi:hypothetical protein